MSTTESADTLEPTSTRPRYDEYEDSGVEWLGEVPAEWDVARLKFLADFTGGGTPSKDNREYWGGDIPWVSPKDMKAGRVVETQDQITSEAVEESSTRLVDPGSVLIVVRSGILKHTIPVATNEVEVALNQDLKAVTPNERLHSRYLAYLVEGRNDTLLLKWTKSGTTVESLEQKRVSNTEVPVPSFDEQRTIATFLDRETGRIDALIEKKERLIDLLEEKRTALISRVVTKGLDRDVEMQDSGVEWLGEIPKHWKSAKVRYLCDVKRGASPRPIEDPKYFDEDGEYSWVRISDVTKSDQYLYETEQTLSEEGKSRSVPIEPDELLISIAATVGKPIITKIKCCIHDGFVHLSGLEGSKDFYYYVFSGGEIYKGVGKQGTQLNLNTDSVGNLRVPVPSVEEQREIVSYLDQETERLDTLINRTKEAIERLKEYRTALISAAVTGQIDVREEVPAAPAE